MADSTGSRGLPSFGTYTSPDDDPSRDHLLYCNDCLCASDYVRSYSLFTIIFLFIFIVWRFDTVLKCPSCTRRHVLMRLPLTILLANLFVADRDAFGGRWFLGVRSLPVPSLIPYDDD